MSYVQRKIDVTFTLGANLNADGYAANANQPAGAQKTFAGTNGANQVKVTGRRVVCNISQAGQGALTHLSLRIFGMTLSLMNQLATWGQSPLNISRTSITIESGDDVSGMSTIFVGNITDAMIDFNSMPEVAFQVSAFTGAAVTLTAGKSSSYNAIVDTATVMKDLAGRVGMNFTNNGVTSRLSYPYFHGTYGDQIASCARQANIEYSLDQNTLAIWPKGSTRNSQAIVISPQTGMKGYPTFFPLGMNVEMEHNPSIGLGSLLIVQSSIVNACGKWIVYHMQHYLASEMPDGPWFTEVQVAKPGSVPVISYG